jgi:hypothetical protein
VRITLRWGLVAAAALAAFALPPAVVLIRNAAARPAPAAAAATAASAADLGDADVSPDARRLAHWIARTGDNAGAMFILVDKRGAQMLVFDRAARLRGATPVLLGSAPGDDTAPGVGDRPLAAVRPEERTTPAGRFVAQAGRNLRGEDVLWVSYADGVSIHPVLLDKPAERRQQRLDSPQVDDNRVSYGCINVPTEFFERTVRPLLSSRVVVYVLPETRRLEQAFRL